MAKTKTAKGKVGRPKRVFTEAQIRKITKCALAGCQTATIASIMDIPEETLRVNFGGLLVKKRAERKLNIRNHQNKHMKNNPTMSIFIGKNELGQTDKTETELSGNIKVVIDN